MGIYIKGIEMPTEGTVIAIYKLDGKFYASVHGTELCPIVTVPSHGRLIDADALKEKKKHSNEFAENVVSVAEIDWMPTVIETEAET